MSKRLNKYIVAFNHFDKVLIVLSATGGGISIISFYSIIGTPIGVANASFRFAFSLTTGIINKLLKTTKNKKRNIIRFLC